MLCLWVHNSQVTGCHTVAVVQEEASVEVVLAFLGVVVHQLVLLEVAYSVAVDLVEIQLEVMGYCTVLEVGLMGICLVVAYTRTALTIDRPWQCGHSSHTYNRLLPVL